MHTFMTLFEYIQFECGDYPGILYGIFIVPQNKRVYMYNVMFITRPSKKRTHMAPSL